MDRASSVIVETDHMDVFLVPVASDRYELYCEETDDPQADVAAPPTGFFRRLVYRFRELLAEAERERRRTGTGNADTPQPFSARVRKRIMRYVAESIAEQRLLSPVLAGHRQRRAGCFRRADAAAGAQRHRVLLCLPHRRALSVGAWGATGDRAGDVVGHAEHPVVRPPRHGGNSPGRPRGPRARGRVDVASRAPRRVLSTYREPLIDARKFFPRARPGRRRLYTDVP
jgi:hypothetical protein